MQTTMNKVLRRVDRVKPNALDDAVKARWLVQLDQRVYHELTQADRPDKLPVSAWPEDGDLPLLAETPYDSIYELYLQAMIEFTLAEYDSYNNTVALFVSDWDRYRAWYRRTNRPEAVYIKGV